MSTDQVERPGTGLVEEGVTLWPTRHQVRRVRPLRWHWYLTDEKTGRVLASGYAPLERWAVRRREMTAQRIWARRDAWAKRWAKVKISEQGQRG